MCLHTNLTKRSTRGSVKQPDTGDPRPGMVTNDSKNFESLSIIKDNIKKWKPIQRVSKLPTFSTWRARSWIYTGWPAGLLILSYLGLGSQVSLFKDVLILTVKDTTNPALCGVVYKLKTTTNNNNNDQ